MMPGNSTEERDEERARQEERQRKREMLARV
jgi:hypothetical protein